MKFKHCRLLQPKIGQRSLVFILLVFSVISCTPQSNKDNPLITLLLLGALTSAPGSNFEIRYDTSIHTRSPGATLTSFGVRSGSNSSTTLISDSTTTNLAGRDIADYGDSTVDAYADKFLTPREVVMGIIAIYAYKSEANGGPAPGTENSTNGEVLWECTLPEGSPADFCWTDTVLTSMDGNAHNILDLAKIPDSNYDRLGIGIVNFQEEFAPEDVLEPNYRWAYFRLDMDYLNLALPSDTTHGESMFSIRYGSPAIDYTHQVDSDYLANSEFGAHVPTIYKRSLALGYTSPDTLGGDPNGAPLMYSPVPVYTQVSGESKLLFETPTDLHRADPYYIKVLTISDPSILTDASKLIVYLDPTNTLFFDANPSYPDRVTFNPAEDAPAVGGTDSTPDRDFKLHLPVMVLGYE